MQRRPQSVLLVLALAGLSLGWVACTNESPATPTMLQPAFSRHDNVNHCSDDHGGGEIIGSMHALAPYSVEVHAANPSQQPDLTTSTLNAGHDCGSGDAGEWGLVGMPNSTYGGGCGVGGGEEHYPFTGTEAHCIKSGRFTIGEITVDWTKYDLVGGGISVEDPAAINGVESSTNPDVLVFSNEAVPETFTKQVHISVANAVGDTWSDAVYTQNTNGTTNTVTMGSGQYLRIGAWDALQHNGNERHLLVRYDWGDGTTSGYANAWRGDANLARVKLMPSGCRNVTAHFRLSNNLEYDLVIPVQAGQCSTSGSVSVSMGAYPESAVPGASCTYSANVTGGTAPFTYHWSFGSPIDWQVDTSPRTFSTPSSAFWARVYVTDANGTSSSVDSVHVNVVGSQTPSCLY